MADVLDGVCGRPLTGRSHIDQRSRSLEKLEADVLAGRRRRCNCKRRWCSDYAFTRLLAEVRRNIGRPFGSKEHGPDFFCRRDLTEVDHINFDRDQCQNKATY